MPAPALVRHPCVAWEREPTRFIEVSEGLPALEIMTQGEHIGFRLLDPVRTDEHRKAEAQDELLPPRWRTQRARLRGLMLLPDGDGRARLVRLTAAQLRVDELVSQGWKVPVAARAELDAALRVLAAHFQVASDAEAGHEVRGRPPPARRTHARTARACAWPCWPRPSATSARAWRPGSGRTRVTTVHQGLTLSTRRDLTHERALFDKLLEALDFLEDDLHEWQLDEPEQALAAVEGLSRLGEDIVSRMAQGQADARACGGRGVGEAARPAPRANGSSSTANSSSMAARCCACASCSTWRAKAAAVSLRWAKATSWR